MQTDIKAPELVSYPLALSYVPQWDRWEIVRELVQNAMDADPGYKFFLTPKNTLTIDSAVGQIEPRHLLMGISEKADENARGQWGEGMKLAMLVASRLGITINIYSGNYHYWNTITETFGQQTLGVMYVETGEYNHGTIVQIPHWDGPIFNERFLREGDPRIVFQDSFGRRIVKLSDPSIFVKGIWIAPAVASGNTFSFGYDLPELTVDRDRNSFRSWEVNYQIARTWAQVTDVELLTELFIAIQDHTGERDMHLMAGTSIASKTAWKAAFARVYGASAVVSTGEDDAKREAEYRGAKVVELPYGLRQSLPEVLPTDESYVLASQRKSIVHVDEKRLSDFQKKTLRLLRKLTQRYGDPSWHVRAYDMLDRGLNLREEGVIFIHHRLLNEPSEALATWAHEMTHQIHATKDNTPEHTELQMQLLARVTANALLRI